MDAKFHLKTSSRDFVAVFLLILLASGFQPLHAQSLRKPAKTVLRSSDEPTRIAVKFKDGLNIRLRNNTLVSTNAKQFAGAEALFARLATGHWDRAETIAEEDVDRLRQRAETNLGRALPDLNLQFYLTLPAGASAAQVIDELNQRDIVDRAQPIPRAAPPPLPPSYQANQAYFNPAPVGGGVSYFWTNYGVFGSNVNVGDVEYSINTNHQDLPPIVNLTPTAVDPFNDPDHGTATTGEIVAMQNGFGTTGAASGAKYFFAGAEYPAGYNVGAGISVLASQLNPGDIILIEQQLFGPNSTFGVEETGGQYGMVPVEWFEPYYDDIVQAVGNGIIVIEAAANGGQDLDDPIYSTGNGGFYPFQPQNHSGAILVGACGSYNGSTTENSRLYYSDHGSRVDVQNWGENIYTTGYGDLYNAEGANLYYTATFGGTSGATPIVVGEAALLQSIYKKATSQVLTPAQMLTILRNTGQPETSGTYPSTDNIGLRPNVLLAAQTVLANSGAPTLVKFSTNATGILGGAITLSVAASGQLPMTYQWLRNGTNIADAGRIFGAHTAQLLLTALSSADAGAYTVAITNGSGHLSVSPSLSVVPDPALAPGVTISNLYSFTAAYDGEGPVGITDDGNGNFYGVEEYGGTNGYGGVFAFTPGDTNFSVLWSFQDFNDGGYPVAPMTLGSDGNFYGTTEGDGSTTSGSVFQLTPSGQLNPLYDFTGFDDGYLPEGQLIEYSPGLFYGTTEGGGSASSGVIFSIDTFGNQSVVHNFSPPDSYSPRGGLVLAGDGNFYGTTYSGGTNDLGTIYRFTPSQQFQDIFSFSGANGQNPVGNLAVGLDGKLYGLTYVGGQYNLGAIFSITTNAQFQLLASFNGTNGANPNTGLLAGRDGNLYGSVVFGGTNNNDGVLFEITPSGNDSIVAYFNGDNGEAGTAPLIRDTNGTIYGATFNGGAYGSGNLYSLNFDSSPPQFQSATRNSGQFYMNFRSSSGRTYQLQSTTNLLSGWAPVGSPILATNSITQVFDTLMTIGDKFYRLELQEP